MIYIAEIECNAEPQTGAFTDAISVDFCNIIRDRIQKHNCQTGRLNLKCLSVKPKMGALQVTIDEAREANRVKAIAEAAAITRTLVSNKNSDFSVNYYDDCIAVHFNRKLSDFFKGLGHTVEESSTLVNRAVIRLRW